jgi:hypothetical protein
MLGTVRCSAVSLAGASDWEITESWLSGFFPLASTKDFADCMSLVNDTPRFRSDRAALGSSLKGSIKTSGTDDLSSPGNAFDGVGMDGTWSGAGRRLGGVGSDFKSLELFAGALPACGESVEGAIGVSMVGGTAC